MQIYVFQNTPFQMLSWEFFLMLGLVVVITAAIIERPKGFPIGVTGCIFLGVLLGLFGLFGTKFMAMIIRWNGLGLDHSPIDGPLAVVSGWAYLGSVPALLLAIALFTKLRLRKIGFWTVTDYLAPFLLLHQAFVRIGCFASGCCYGKPTGLPWGCLFRDKVLRHPTQIYEICYIVLIFIVMRHVYRKGAPPAVTYLGCMCLYGGFRFFNEFLRVDSLPVVGPLTVANLTMLGISVISGFAIVIILQLKRSAKVKIQKSLI